MRCRDRRDVVDTSANGLISLYGKNGILRLVRLTVGARCSVSHLESCFALEAHIVLRSGEGVDRLSGRDARESRECCVLCVELRRIRTQNHSMPSRPSRVPPERAGEDRNGAPVAANATRSA